MQAILSKQAGIAIMLALLTGLNSAQFKSIFGFTCSKSRATATSAICFKTVCSMLAGDVLMLALLTGSKSAHVKSFKHHLQQKLRSYES